MFLQNHVVPPNGKATYLDEVKSKLLTERFKEYRKKPALDHKDLFTNNKIIIQNKK